MPDQKLPYLEPFDQKSKIVLTPAPNGGWVVTDKGKMGECDNIGNYIFDSPINPR